jgi:hypothetical protein
LEHYEDGYRWPPFPWWPEDGCLVQWASVEFHDFHWLTEGEPDQWPVIVLHREHLLERLDMTATEVIKVLLAGPAPVEWLNDYADLPTSFRPGGGPRS